MSEPLHLPLALIDRMISINRTHVRILVVDPDPELLQTMKDELGLYGFSVETALSGASALKQCQAERCLFRALILAHSIPSGRRSLIRRLRAAGFAGQIVVVFDRVDARQVSAYRKVGVSGFLCRPFASQALSALLTLP